VLNAEVNSKFTSAFTHSAFRTVAVVCCCASAILLTGAQQQTASGPTAWPDLAPLHKQLDARGISEAALPTYLDRLRQTHAARVREGDLDHLIFYLLQSQAFTTIPAIEPALSAKALVEGFELKEREAFLRTGAANVARVPEGVRARIGALLRALGAPSRDERILYFGELVQATFPQAAERANGLSREYLRVMRFV